MVRKMLDGMKTQTRRLVKVGEPDEHGQAYFRGRGHAVLFHPQLGPIWRPAAGADVQPMPSGELAKYGPYGVAGDRLWVRETLELGDDGETWCYAADGAPIELPAAHPSRAAMVAWAHHKESDVCTSIHMPRWASRILLEVVSVRVERLHAITGDDVLAEGLVPIVDGERGNVLVPLARLAEWEAAGKGVDAAHRLQFADLWDRINRKRAPWESNPWVWRIEFRRVA